MPYLALNAMPLALALALPAATTAQDTPGVYTPIVPERFEGAYSEFHFAPGVGYGELILLSGVVAVMPDGENPDQAAFEQSFDRTFQTIDLILAEAGASHRDILSMTVFHTDIQDPVRRAAFAAAKDRYLQGPPWPAETAVGVAELWDDHRSPGHRPSPGRSG